MQKSKGYINVAILKTVLYVKVCTPILTPKPSNTAVKKLTQSEC